MNNTTLIRNTTTFLRMARRRRQSGELSMIEAAGVMAGAALIALAVYAGRGYVMDRIHAYQFKSEAQLFRSGIQDATSSDTDFSSESLQTLAQNHAFDAAGSRVNTTAGTLTGIFGGAVAASPGTVSTTDDAIVLTYPVPATVCSLSAGAVAGAYTMVQINSTTVAGPSTTFNSSTAGQACNSAGATASIAMYATHNN
ncbi:type 4 pilus major pilin [Paraburkholderia sp. BL10I2N1]|uniref:type 4 pilus major pilin n=1 Tax=Paraburkholderia sp. BL10I2N1 TaxID=1938796 RepID=UPI00105BA1B3|nr:type 4 pilus major pilin [Paraburkholderia sp. BL10I2N1]TDN59091.1 PilS-like protein [Paraburkholderia sp. BL10I2N1]